MPETNLAVRTEFIQFWGEMASRWGISRAKAQILALLFLSSKPLDAEAIMHTLNISRGNASMNLRKLEEWGLVTRIEADSRRDFFIAEKDVWKLTLQIIQVRRSNEITPISRELSRIQQQLEAQTDAHDPESAEFRQKIAELDAFLKLFNSLTEDLIHILQTKDLNQIEALVKLLR
jgi:DNA-binding transcriptional regulator GbsR (MarR family)